MATWSVDAEALTLSGASAVNVTPSRFDVFIQTSEPATPWIEVYADAGGATNLAGQVGLELSPMHTADPAVTTNYFRRLGVRMLQARAREKSLALIRVTGCDPGTQYFYRIHATNDSGDAVSPPVGPLPSVTTERRNSLVVESRQLLVDVHHSVFPPSAEGAMGLLVADGADYPLASWVGDGAVSNQVYFDLSGLFSATTHENMQLTGSPSFQVTFPGPPNQASLVIDFSVPFSNATQVAMATSGSAIRSYVLDIRSVAGQANPPVGLYTNVWGTTIACAVTSATVGNATTQQVALGWVANGYDPTVGSNTSVQVTLTNDVVLTWNWKTQYWLDTEAGEHGSVDQPDQWVDAASVITIAAQPDVYYHVDSWGGTINGTSPGTDQLSVPMTQARAIIAMFAENTTANGVPQGWLAEHGFTNADWQAASLQDQDGDGMLTWEEYVAGTSPTNNADLFAVEIQYVRTNDTTTLIWPSVSNRLYKVWRSTDLAQGFRQLSGNLPATPPVNTFRAPAISTGTPRYYRISVTQR